MRIQKFKNLLFRSFACANNLKTDFLIFFVYVVTFFVFLFFFDFPKPMIDDLFFIGAGINMSENGILSNPLITRQGFPSNFYYVHPPIHSFFLAGWFSFFGLSAQSLLLFQCLIYIALSLSAYGVFFYFETPFLFRLLIPFGIMSAFISIGLRPEALAACMTLLGFLLLIYQVNFRKRYLFLGFLFIFIGGSTASRLTVFSAGFVLVAFIILFYRFRVPKLRLQIILMLLGSLILTFVFLSLMISFDFGNFFTTYLYHAKARVGGNIIQHLINFISGVYGISHAPLFVIFIVINILCIINLARRDIKINDYKEGETILLIFAINLSLILALFTSTLGHGAVWFIFFGMLIASQFIFRNFPTGIYKLLFVLSIVFSVLLSNSKAVVNILGILSNRISNDFFVENLHREDFENSVILIDSWTARYAFDYRLPKGSLDWSFSAKFPKMLAVSDELNINDLYIIGPESVDSANKAGNANAFLSRWSPFGSQRWSFFSKPKSIFIVPSSCMIRK